MTFRIRTLACLLALALYALPGTAPSSAQTAQSRIDEIRSPIQLAQSGKKGVVNPCFINGRVPCGQTCCPKGYRCGDSKCHKRPTGGAVGGSPATTQGR